MRWSGCCVWAHPAPSTRTHTVRAWVQVFIAGLGCFMGLQKGGRGILFSGVMVEDPRPLWQLPHVRPKRTSLPASAAAPALSAHHA